MIGLEAGGCMAPASFGPTPYGSTLLNRQRVASGKNASCECSEFPGSVLAMRAAVKRTVNIDGVTQTIDNYRATGWQQVVYSAVGLPSGAHTLTLTALGTKQTASCGPWIYVDAFRCAALRCTNYRVETSIRRRPVPRLFIFFASGWSLAVRLQAFQITHVY
jgi:hypothetical protein